jgi:hypothetical protein
MIEKRYNTREAARFLAEIGVPRAVGTLEVYRCRRIGPSYVKVNGRPYYTETALLKFAAGDPVETR